MSHTPVSHRHQQLKDQLLSHQVQLLTPCLSFLLTAAVLSVWWLCMLVLE